MIRFLRSGQPATFFFSLLLILLARIPLFWVQAKTEFAYQPQLVDFVFAEIKQYPILDYFLTAIIVLIQGFWLNGIYEKHSVLGRRTHLIFLFYGLSLSVYPPLLSINLFHLLAFGIIYFIDGIYAKADSKSTQAILFELGLIIGLSVLLNAQFWLLLLVLYLALQSFHPFRIKFWVTPILGMLTPIYLFFGVHYLLDYPLSPILDRLIEGRKLSNALDLYVPESWQYATALFFLLVFLVPLFTYFGRISISKVRISKLFGWNLWMFILSLMLGLSSSLQVWGAWVLAAPITAIIYTVFIINQQKERSIYLALFGFVVVLIFNNTLPWLV